MHSRRARHIGPRHRGFPSAPTITSRTFVSDCPILWPGARGADSSATTPPMAPARRVRLRRRQELGEHTASVPAGYRSFGVAPPDAGN